MIDPNRVWSLYSVSKSYASLGTARISMKKRRHSGQAAIAALIRNPSKGVALYDGFRVSAPLRPE